MPAAKGTKSKMSKSAAGDKPAKKSKAVVDRNAFSSYIYRVLKQNFPEATTSKKTMLILNSFIYDIFEKICNQAAEEARKAGKSTLSSAEIQSAVELIMPAGLAETMIENGKAAKAKFMAK